MKRILAAFASAAIIVGVLSTPTPAGASDENLALAVNQTDGAALVEASVQFRKAANNVVDEQNRAHALANCVGCQTLAAAFQLVIVTKPPQSITPVNDAFAANVLCADCLTFATAKQVIVGTGGPAELTENGRARLRALDARLEALESTLSTMSLTTLVLEIDSAFQELLRIAEQEIVRTDGSTEDPAVLATRSAA